MSITSDFSIKLSECVLVFIGFIYKLNPQFSMSTLPEKNTGKATRVVSTSYQQAWNIFFPCYPEHCDLERELPRSES